MKSETFVCIVPSPTIPLGSKARWHEGWATYHIYTPSDNQIWISQTKTPHDDIIELGALCLTREQVEQNPECWQRVSTDNIDPVSFAEKHGQLYVARGNDITKVIIN